MLRTVPELRRTIRYMTYEELFLQLNGPIGHYVFCDIDRLSRYERETAGNFADALRRAAPDARILNHPCLTLDRVPFLQALFEAGLNGFNAVRLDVGRPSRYPVFIRTEDGHFGPESGLLEDEAAFDAAIEDLRARRLPLRGRIAVGFAATPSADGKYRRYSAYRIGERVFAEEVFFSTDWAVKGDTRRFDEATIAEELAYVRANPHAETLRRAFAIANAEFGRADYGLLDGRVQVYEINTNPAYAIMPGSDGRNELRGQTRPMMVDAFRQLDTPIQGRGRVRFAKPRFRSHTMRWPSGWRLAVSTAQRLGNFSRPLD